MRTLAEKTFGRFYDLENHRLADGKFWRVCLLWDPRDLWIGVYWDAAGFDSGRWVKLDVYICIIPCLPVHVRVWR